MSISAARVERLVWVLIYGGLLAASLGFALQRGGRGFGWALVAGGAVAALAGTILLWVRSRMSDSPGR